MKKYKIKSVMLTSIRLSREKLITKEKMETYCKGEKDLKESVNDDLESLFEDIRIGKELNEDAFAYYLPKLTEEELELVGKKDPSYLQTLGSLNPDVDETEMMLSESDSKYVRGYCCRSTLVINNSSKTYSVRRRKFVRTFIHNSSENLFVIENLDNDSLKNNCSLQ